MAAPSLDKKRFSVVFAICLALSLLPALFYAYMDMEPVEYYAAHGVDMSTHPKTLPLNYWPTSLSLLCYAHIGIDGIARSVLSRKDVNEGPGWRHALTSPLPL